MSGSRIRAMFSISCCGMPLLLVSFFRLLSCTSEKYFAAAFSRAAEEWRLERLLSSVLFFPSHPSFPI